MSAVGRYRLFLRLIQDWPVDETKVGRDLGTVIRRRVAEGFKQGEVSSIDEAKCTQIYDSLATINSNHYRNLYPRLKDTCSSGLSLDECRVVSSTDTLEFLKAEDQSMIQRVKGSFTKQTVRDQQKQ